MHQGKNFSPIEQLDDIPHELFGSGITVEESLKDLEVALINRCCELKKKEEQKNYVIVDGVKYVREKT